MKLNVKVKNLNLSRMDISDLLFITDKHNKYGAKALSVDELLSLDAEQLKNDLFEFNKEVVIKLLSGFERDNNGTSLFYIHKTLLFMLDILNQELAKIINMEANYVQNR